MKSSYRSPLLDDKVAYVSYHTKTHMWIRMPFSIKIFYMWSLALCGEKYKTAENMTWWKTSPPCNPIWKLTLSSHPLSPVDFLLSDAITSISILHFLFYKFSKLNIGPNTRLDSLCLPFIIKNTKVCRIMAIVPSWNSILLSTAPLYHMMKK